MILLIWSSSAQAEDEWRAHEWGTFTTFHAPEGDMEYWYPIGKNEPGELPEFVGMNVFTKGGMMVNARMETPVIYFYTDRLRSVDVKATYVDGNITERYPWKSGVGSVGQWENLLVYPPGELGEDEITPPVGEAGVGEHYYHAREVPEAAMVLRASGREPQAERFIFYRGAGPMKTDLRPVLREGGELMLSNHRDDEPATHLWAVMVDGDTVRWGKLPAVPARDENDKAGVIEVNLSQLDEAVSENAVPSMRESFESALISEGLTRKEAEAMVKTWSDSWFVEPGTRVFRVMPRKVVDAMLPLEITPKPDVINRVFVHRMELLSPEARDVILAALEDVELDHGKVREVAELEFGRFRNAALSSAALYRNQQFANETQRRQQLLQMAGTDLESDLAEATAK
ncbi:MAG: hypothetical protein AAGA58_12615 [Verrucomicrobiota bacterium]